MKPRFQGNISPQEGRLAPQKLILTGLNCAAKDLDVFEDNGSTLVATASKGATMTWNEAVDAFLATLRSSTGAPVIGWLKKSRMRLRDNEDDHTAGGVDFSMVVGSPWRNTKNLTTKVRFFLRAASHQFPFSICWKRKP